MVIDLGTYRNYNEAIKDLCKVNKLFINTFPNKTWGWIGLTALLYSMKAMEMFIKNDNPAPEYYKAMKSVLWNFQELMNKSQAKKKG